MANVRLIKFMFGWLNKLRKYASHWEAPSKELKECGIAQDWLGSIGDKSVYNIRTLKAVDDQWPDCEIKNNSGENCGIEITEIVEPLAVRENEKGNDVYRLWEDPEVIEAIKERLDAKNLKSHGGKYQKLIVLLHTDEFEITHDRFDELVSKHEFSGLNNIDEAYLLYSYKDGKYPVTKLDIKA